MTQRTIKTSKAAVIIDSHITTPVTLDFFPAKDSSNINVFKVYQKNSTY